MSRILVVGGTGYAGGNITQEAAARGHNVTVVSRHAPTDPVDGVTYVEGDAVATAVPLMARFDVVVAALSPRGDNAGTLVEVYRTLADAASAAGARFIAIGGFGSLRPAVDAPRFAEGEMPPEYAAESREMNAVYQDLASGDQAADWLFVSPASEFGSFNPGTKEGHYRISGEVALFDADGVSAISGADFGAAVMDEIEHTAHHREHIGFAY